jgi:hypothetical protein
LPRHAEIISEQRLGSGRTHAHENTRLHQANLSIEPWMTRLNFARARLLMDSPLSTFIGRPLEVLHDICDIDLVAVDPCKAQSVV